MASHYVSLNRGKEGLKSSDFTTGTSSASTDVFELRILDGASVTHLDVEKALYSFKRFFQDIPRVVSSGFDVTT